MRRADGSALVEAVLVGLALLVPVVYLVLAAAAVQRAAFAVTGAVRDAGRAYATAGSDAAGRARADAGVRVALSAAGVDVGPGDLTFACSPAPCAYAPGSAVVVRLRVRVALPWLPVGGIPVSARHAERIDCWAALPGRPQAGAC